MSLVEYAGNVQADASGIGRVRIGPPTAVAYWHVTGMTSVVANSVLTPQLRVYKGYESPSTLVNSTLRAGATVSTQDDIPLAPGEILIFVWSNCTPGAWCTATIRGEQTG